MEHGEGQLQQRRYSVLLRYLDSVASCEERKKARRSGPFICVIFEDGEGRRQAGSYQNRAGYFPAGASSPRSFFIASMFGSRPRQFLYIVARSSVLPRESTM